MKPPVRTVEHAIDVAAPAEDVFSLLAEVEKWPTVFGPTIHAEVAERSGDGEVIRIWASANDTARTWTSRRVHRPGERRIDFRQERTQHPVGAMGGAWIVSPVGAGACHVRLLHDYSPATSEPADLEWIDRAVEHNSTAELAALRARAEDGSEGGLLTFEDSVMIRSRAVDVFAFLDAADRWPQRLPHVRRVVLDEPSPGLQVLEMDTKATDGTTHTTRSVRVCLPHHRIVYKQNVLPALLSLHTGSWAITEVYEGEVSVVSEHTIRIAADRVAEVLGAAATVDTARRRVREALSANSAATLRLAKEFCESADG